ncbi:MAG TPA: hypothetical protein VM284_02560 [Candidatus Limnocylindria bacterium]|nr:hypothetical protein [Candidatus Limnocylindria bacterium]
MSRRSPLLAAIGLTMVIGLVSACEGFAFNTPGKLTVTNTSASETAIVAIQGDDIKSYPTLGPGASATVATSTGGTYTVTVIMSTVDATSYRNNLQTLRSNVEKVIDGTASSDEKIVFFTHLAGVKVAIQQAQGAGGASCSGSIKLSEGEAASVAAVVTWQSSLGSGFWSMTCGSNN